MREYRRYLPDHVKRFEDPEPLESYYFPFLREAVERNYVDPQMVVEIIQSMMSDPTEAMMIDEVETYFDLLLN
jgi:hypothetical protein